MSDHRPRVLIVEDNLLLAAELALALEACGCAVAGPARTVAEGLASVREDSLDGALLDIQIGADLVWPVAEQLEARGIPFVLVTGRGREAVPEHYRARPLLPKPAGFEAIVQALRTIGASQP